MAQVAFERGGQRPADRRDAGLQGEAVEAGAVVGEEQLEPLGRAGGDRGGGLIAGLDGEEGQPALLAV